MEIVWVLGIELGRVLPVLVFLTGKVNNAMETGFLCAVHAHLGRELQLRTFLHYTWACLWEMF